MSRSYRCKFCKRELRWQRLDSGRRIPLDPRPDNDGTVFIYEDGTATEYDSPGQALGVKLTRNGELYRRHSCSGSVKAGLAKER